MDSTVIIEEQLFNECFWKFIKEKVGISRIYPTNTNSRSKNKKVLSMEERQERIAMML